MSVVLIAGGSGLVGQYLAKYLHDKNYTVRILSRKKRQSDSDLFTTFIWDVAAGYIDKEAFSNVDYIINLAGENIGSKRWSKKRKKEILLSRTDSTKLLFQKTIEYKVALKSFVTASAVGYYGTLTSEKIFDETDKPATDFLGNVCDKWESVSSLFSKEGIRTVQIRTGLVLTPKSGALEKIANPIKKGFGAVLGNGKQYIPWIHIKDLCGIYEFALQQSKIEGAYNAVAPEHIDLTTLTHSLAKLHAKKIWIPNVPAFIPKLFLGEMANIILFGSRVSDKKIVQEGFKFSYQDLDETLASLLPN